MVRDFRNAVFPKFLGYDITEENGDVILIVKKEFGEEFYIGLNTGDYLNLSNTYIITMVRFWEYT